MVNNNINDNSLVSYKEYVKHAIENLAQKATGKSDGDQNKKDEGTPILSPA